MAGEFSAEGENILGSISAGLYQAAIVIFAQSQVEVPVEFGVLKASGRVFEPEREGDDITVTLGYGYGTAVRPSDRDPDQMYPAGAYAIPVHERLDLHHDAPTKAKYLEDPVLEYAPQLQGELAASIMRARKLGDVLLVHMEEIR